MGEGVQEIKIPTYLSHEITLKENDEDVVYRAEAVGLWVDGADIRGQARISKIVRKRFLGILIPITRWTIKSSPFAAKYFISEGNGGVVRFGSDFKCLHALRNEALKKGILFSQTFLENIFQPIEEELVKYHTLVRDCR